RREGARRLDAARRGERAGRRAGAQRRARGRDGPLPEDRDPAAQDSAQNLIRWWAMATGGGTNTPPAPGCASDFRMSARANQRASSSSLLSTVTLSLSARARHPIMSEDGNGQGCDAK